MKKIYIYSKGLAHCSVCVYEVLKISEIEKLVNMENPTGIKSKWRVSKEDFNDGSKNPHRCEHEDNKLHYLLVC